MDITRSIAGTLRPWAGAGVIRGTPATKTMGMPITAIPIPIRTIRTCVTATTTGTEMEWVAEAMETTGDVVDTTRGECTIPLRGQGTTTRAGLITGDSERGLF